MKETGVQPQNSRTGQAVFPKVDVDSIARHLGIPRELALYAMLNEKQLAGLLGVSESFIQKKRISGGFIPYRRIGRACRYMVADVIAAIELMSFSSTSETQKQAGADRCLSKGG